MEINKGRVVHSVLQAAVPAERTVSRRRPGLLDAVTHHLSHGLLLLDERELVVQATETAARLFGLEPAALVGRPAGELIEGASLLCQQASAANVSQTAVIYPSDSDHPLPVRVTVLPLKFEEERLTLFSLVTLDPDEPWGERLVQNDRLAGIGLLTSSITHDLTNPISIILTTCNNIDDLLNGRGELQDSFAHYVDMIKNNAARCARLIDQLRLYTHNESLRTSMAVNPIIEHAVNLVTAQFEKRDNLRLNLGLAPELPPISCDPNQIIQVLINMLINARDAMPNSGGEIWLSSWSLPEVGAVAIGVQDNGRGIPDEVLPRIFEPFFTTKPRGLGTGLGLFIAAEIIQNHDGWIRVQNRIELQSGATGTQFTIVLPSA